MIALTFEITKHESSKKNNDTVGARCECSKIIISSINELRLELTQLMSLRMAQDYAKSRLQNEDDKVL